MKKNSRTTKKRINSKEKNAVITGGLELLTKLVSPELSKGGFLEQYKKSLYVFACISKIAEKVASIDFNLYRILNSAGDTKEIPTHPAIDLIYKPNPFQTKTEFMEITIINLKTTGEAFWYKVRNKGGRVIELWNLRPDLMTIVSDPINFIKEYRLTKNNGTTESFDPQDIIYFKYPDPLSNYIGMSPLRAAQLRVQTEEYATRFQRDFFLNNARPDAIIKNPNRALDREQKEDIREDWHRKFRGVGKNSQIAILSGGLDYQQIAITQKEMDYIESLRFTRDDILAAFKVPKPIVAIVDDVNRANSETAMFIFLSETIVPEVKRLIEKINEEMIIQDFGEEFFFDFEDPTPENREMKRLEYESGIKNNYYLINEVRQWEGLPPVKGGWSFYMPLVNQAFGGLPTAEKKSLMEKLFKDSDNNEGMIVSHNENKKKVIFDFKGKFWLKQKFMIYETMLKSVVDSMSIKNRKKTKRKKAFVSLLKDAELKKSYAVMINKKIDVKSDKLKNAMDEFAFGQKNRVLAKLENQKSFFKKKKINIENLFNEDEEIGLAINFISPYIESYLREAGLDALNMIAPQNDFNDNKRIQKFIKQRAEMFAESVNNTTLEKLDATLAEGIEAGEGVRDLANRVESVYEDFPAYRSEMIARTEATAANNEGFLEAFKQSDVATGKEWINAGDNRVRPEHEDGIGVGGEIVALNDNFSNGLPYPMEVNCRCVIGPAFLE